MSEAREFLKKHIMMLPPALLKPPPPPEKKKRKKKSLQNQINVSAWSVEGKEVFAEAFGYAHIEQQMDGYTDGLFVTSKQ